MFGSKFLYISLKTDTSGIEISNNFTNMKCDPNIEIIKTNNTQSFYFDKSLPYQTNLKETICTFDKIFDGSDEDRALLYGFIDAKLEWSFVARHDIAQYFYWRIIASNPDDALSQYLKKEKIESAP